MNENTNTPLRQPPNSSRKRQSTPNLSRAVKNSSHHVRMTQIFRDAAADLSSSPFYPESANTKKTRIAMCNMDLFPPVQASLSLQEDLGPPSLTQAHQDMKSPKSIRSAAREPIISGLSMPARSQPQAENLQATSPTCYSSSMEEDDHHSSHGVPLVIPIHRKGMERIDDTMVDVWLEDVFMLSPHIQKQEFKSRPRARTETLNDSNLKVPGRHGSPKLRTPFANSSHSKNEKLRVASNKENVPPTNAAFSWNEVGSPYSEKGAPKYLSLPPRRLARSSDSCLSPPKTPGYFNLPASKSTYRTPHPFFHLTPKRQKPRTSPSSLPPVPNNTPVDKSAFGIQEDDDELVELSPVVECHRKGQGPKRGRCLSYYDWDILLSQESAKKGTAKTTKGKNVLREVESSAELMRGVPFLEEAEDAEFEFRT
ncbi:hypothetical protein MMC14_007146 [Varicellaria rhodocarpa]|nr:hypothetical protein [Varicellaria rhodocarpa]